MADERLKQIWGGFERQTSRRLTGGGVDNIHVPDSREMRAGMAAPEDVAEPAAAAFAALKLRLKASGKKRGRNGDGDGSAPPEPLAATRINGARDLIRGLRSTEARTLRADRLYGETAGRTGGRRRKKLFGIF